MKTLLDKTLSQIVTEHHQAAQVFEKYGLDFCCKGKRLLKQACQEKQIAEQTIISDLQHAFRNNEDNQDFGKMSLTELAEYIVRVHHNFVRENSPVIFNYVLRVASKHGERYPHMKEVYEIFANVKDDMDNHMEKEEKDLFPVIKLLEMPVQFRTGDLTELEASITGLETDHDAAGSMMQQIRTLTNNYQPPADACTTHRLTLASLRAFEEDLHRHVHLENNILFPKAIARFRENYSILLN